VAGLARREVIDMARRAPGAAAVDADAGIALGNPFLGIDHLPILILVRRAGGHVGMLLGHDLPSRWISLLEGQSLGIGTVAEQHGIAAFLRRAEDIGAQHDAVIHRDRHVPVAAHAVAEFAPAPIHRRGSLPASPGARQSAALFPSALLTRGITSLAINSIERFPSPGSTQSCPA